MSQAVRRLSRRHQEVSDLLSGGMSAAEIASHLGVTLNTAKYYVTVVQRQEHLVAAAAAGVRPALTPRETQIAALLAEGASDRDIAESLGVGVRTVESHVAHVLRTLGRSSRAELGPQLAPNTGLGALSFRELEVLHLITRGHSQEAVAQRLEIDQRTVASHVREIRKKLNMPGDRSLARYGMDPESG